MQTAAITSLTNAIVATNPGQILLVTGAGVSHASGIPTFRGSDPGAIWKRDVMELGTYRFFCEDPAGSWQWYLSRFDKVRDAKPNIGSQWSSFWSGLRWRYGKTAGSDVMRWRLLSPWHGVLVGVYALAYPSGAGQVWTVMRIDPPPRNDGMRKTKRRPT